MVKLLLIPILYGGLYDDFILVRLLRSFAHPMAKSQFFASRDRPWDASTPKDSSRLCDDRPYLAKIKTLVIHHRLYYK